MPTPVDDGIIIDPGTQTGPPTTGAWFKGTIIVDATGTPYICRASGNPGTWEPIGLGTMPPPSLVEQYPEFIDTFVNGLLASQGWSIAALSGTYAQIAPPVAGGRNGVIGVINLTTGTSTTGRVGSILGANLLRFESGNTYTMWCRFLGGALSDANDAYRFHVGFIDSNNATETRDGAYFEYLYPQANWKCKTASNNSRTTVVSSVPVQNTAWIDLKVHVDGTAGVATFYIDDVLVATISTNVPAGNGRETSVGFSIKKTDGGNVRNVYLDRIYFKLNAA